MFNEKKVEIDFLFTEEPNDIDSVFEPRVARSGDELKQNYNSMKSNFTQAYERWSRSGQNDPLSFSDFCGLKSSSVGLYAVERKCY